jgi:hypothetical protein
VNQTPLATKGRPANEPISHKVELTMEQIEAKKRYEEKYEKKKPYIDPTSSDI